MFLKTEIIETVYERSSKLGYLHQYTRKKTVAVFRCDNCDTLFKRDLKNISKTRLDNNYFHCCSECDFKKFAQRKSTESKKIWDMKVSEDIPLSKY